MLKLSNHLLMLGLVLMFGMAEVGFAKDVNVPADYDTIQEAIDAIAADPTVGDTIVVARGTYEESLTLISDITLRGEETARTILKPTAQDNVQPIITATSVNGVIIRNFTFAAAETGISITSSLNVRIENSSFNLGNNSTAIEITDDSTVNVINNTFYDNTTALFRASNVVEIANNIFSDNGLAISSLFVTDNITNNCFSNNDDDGLTGANAEIADNAQFVDVVLQDFHLRQDSPCIDIGKGTDVIDGSDADAGAYGGDFADPLPFPVQGITAADVSAGAGTPSIEINWDANEAYLVTNTSTPGGYKVYYDSDESGPPYDGLDAASGSLPSPVNAGNVATYTLSELSPTHGTPGVPTVTSVSPSNQRVTLNWTTADTATSYKLYWGIASVNEHSIDVGNVTQYTLSGLENGVTYIIAVSALAQATYYISVTAYDNTGISNHESDFATEVVVPLGDATESALSASVTTIPEQVVPYPQLSGEGCFIATAAYGSYDAAQVQALRDFRDQYLLTNAPGRDFVRWYYRNSPAAARYLETHQEWKPIISTLLAPLVLLALFLTHTSWLTKSVVLILNCILLTRFYLRRRRRKHIKALAAS